MKKILITILLFSCFSTVQAQQVMQITWKDLQGKVAAYDNPFNALSDEQFYQLSLYAQVTEMQKFAPEVVNESMLKQAEEAKAQLIKEQIDITYLLQQRLIIMEKRRLAAAATNPLLTDKTIEISGYMLPLEFDNGLVSEFLLVPTVGACSHKPVPAANQLILIKAKKAIEAGSPYMPIRVTGKLQLSTQAQELYLVDGSKQIEMAYRLDNAIVAAF